MPQLRRDFRRVYHVGYDDVAPEEALDLIAGLPDGSEYVASRDPARSWTEGRRSSADVVDAVREVAWALGAYDRTACPMPPRVTRPEQVVARVEESRRARAARERIRGGDWEEA